MIDEWQELVLMNFVTRVVQCNYKSVKTEINGRTQTFLHTAAVIIQHFFIKHSPVEGTTKMKV
jgi:hypothetical protein